MDNQNDDSTDKKYYIHNYNMAEIADCIINDKLPLDSESEIVFSENARYECGVKEIIGLYLLIPYLNNDYNKLKCDGKHEQVSVFRDDDIAFCDIYGESISIKDLRDTLCHSFVTCEMIVKRFPVIVFDDRAIMSRSDHDNYANTDEGNKCVFVKPEVVIEFLKKAYKRILSLEDRCDIRATDDECMMPLLLETVEQNNEDD